MGVEQVAPAGEGVAVADFPDADVAAQCGQLRGELAVVGGVPLGGAEADGARRCARSCSRLEDLGDGRTRVHFTERYECFNPWMRRLGLERWVHQKISRDNDTILAALEGGLAWHRKRRERDARRATPIPPGTTPVAGTGVTAEAAASALQPPMDATNEG